MDAFHEASFTEKCAGFELPPVFCWLLRKFSPAPSGHFMRQVKVFFAALFVAALGAEAAAAQSGFGASGAEGVPDRRQPWRVPSSEPGALAHAVLFRPPGEGPFPLALIAHASTQNVLRRAQMPQPEYRALAAFMVLRGFAVLVPERPGHGATGGNYLEDQGGCDAADYAKAGRATAAAIAVTIGFMRQQAFIRPDRMVVIGHSAGGWGALALAGENPEEVAAIIALAPGRGGHANDFPNQVCAPHTLLAAAAEFGQAARVPVTWLVAANDSYFSPALSRQLADGFRHAGGKVDFRVVKAYGSEGHWLPETEGGVKSLASELDRVLKSRPPNPAGQR